MTIGKFEFCEEIYRLAEKDKKTAIDFIFDRINNLLMAGDFDECCEILDKTQTEKLPPMLLVALLTITAAARKQLIPHRDQFFVRAYANIEAERGKEATDRLLVGLK
jgi:hypothetical protein